MLNNYYTNNYYINKINNTNIMYGKNTIYNTIISNPEIIETIYIFKKNNKIDQIIKEAKKTKINIIYIKRQIQPSFQIICKIKKNQTLLKKTAKITTNPIFLILDRIQDPNNLGACIRTATAANVTAIIITKIKSAKLSPLVSKISCIDTNNTNIIKTDNLLKLINKLKKKNINIIGLSENSQHSIYKQNLNGPIAIIMGSEHKGIEKKILHACDVICKIETFGTNKSLNVSTATGIVLFETQRQRTFQTSIL